MDWNSKEFLGGAQLYDVAGVNEGKPTTQALSKPQIMGYYDQRCATLSNSSQLGRSDINQITVQSVGRLVRDDQVRLTDQSQGVDHPLLHPAGKLMYVLLLDFLVAQA